MKYLRLATLILASILLIAALTVQLDSVPALWWDEGWTLSVARNWAEYGHYGRFLDGQPTRRGFEAAFPMTGLVALSFSLFGTGAFQARMVAVLITLATFVLLYEVARRFYSRSSGIAAVALTCLATRGEINPLIAGRQLVGEMPALFFLLAGYLCFFCAEKRPWVFMPFAIGLWAIALFCKPQVQPFLIAAFLLPLVIALLQRQFKNAKLFAICLIGSHVGHILLVYLAEELSPSVSVAGLTPLLALMLVPIIRLYVLSLTLEFGVPTLLGLSWALWQFWKTRNQLQSHSDQVRFSFFALAGSWFGWWVIFSIGWPRYMFPPAFLGSIFVAAMLADWTNRFDFKWVVAQIGSLLRTLRPSLRKVTALASVILVVTSFARTAKVLYAAHTIYADNSIKDVVQFLNTESQSDALIETYESELFFLLNRRYHYPPDQMAVELLRYRILDEEVRFDYDPMPANPEYLVAGFQSNYWDLYDSQLNSGDFQLLREYTKYRIYQRRR